MTLSSLHNSKVKLARDLHNKRARDETGLFLIEGFRELTRAVDGHVMIKMLFICPALFLGTNEQMLIEKITATGAAVIHTTENIFSKLSYRDRPDGLIAIAEKMLFTIDSLDKRLATRTAPLLILAEAIEKPGNLGTILRTSDAAGADGVIVVDRCTDIYNPNVVRASVGTLFTIPVIETTSREALGWLHKKKIDILAAMPQAQTLLYDVHMKTAIAIVLGTEQLGLSPLWKKEATIQVRIPMYGHADSLNVAQACTILLYEAVRQRQ